jgi:hypothetical protein
MNRAFWTCAATLLLGACGYHERVEAWVGRPEDELVYAWGPPTAASSLSDGRKVLAYRLGNGDMNCEAVFRLSATSAVENASIGGTVGGCDNMLAGKPSPAPVKKAQ